MNGQNAPMDEFRGKVAVVTGAASGIGLGLARRFASEGMRVVMADVEEPALKAAADDLATTGAEVVAVTTDVSDADAVHALAATTFDRFGTAHVVCNNAGIGTGGRAWEVSEAQWRWIIGVNLMGVVHGIQAFVPRMVEQNEGHVVNTASAAGLMTGPGMSPYFATKHAVVALSESLAADLGLAGADVGVSVLCPEWVRTRINESDRNRPDDVPSFEASRPEMAGMREMLDSLVASGIEPEQVAGHVIDAIRAKRLHILTHPTTIEAVRQRFARIEG
jgi:NAD(P)-dependent dehydrogenase (short-subunit alcohol dehydrogenase family)